MPARRTSGQCSIRVPARASRKPKSPEEWRLGSNSVKNGRNICRSARASTPIPRQPPRSRPRPPTRSNRRQEPVIRPPSGVNLIGVGQEVEHRVADLDRTSISKSPEVVGDHRLFEHLSRRDSTNGTTRAGDVPWSRDVRAAIDSRRRLWRKSSDRIKVSDVARRAWPAAGRFPRSARRSPRSFGARDRVDEAEEVAQAEDQGDRRIELVAGDLDERPSSGRLSLGEFLVRPGELRRWPPGAGRSAASARPSSSYCSAACSDHASRVRRASQGLRM